MPDNNGVPENVSIAVMSRDIEYIKQSIEKIVTRLDIMDKNYLSRVEADTILKEFRKNDESFEGRIRILELESAQFKTSVKIWGSVVVGTMALIQFIVGKYF